MENRESFEDAVKNADLPQFDFDEASERLKEAVKANIQHTPRQQGPHIVCVSCPHFHTLVYIGPLKNFKGIGKDGEYILEDRM